MTGHIKYPANRKRSKEYLKRDKLVHIKQLPENEHLRKSDDKEYCRRYAKEYHRIHREEWQKKRAKGVKYCPTATRGTPCEITIKHQKVVVSFD